MFGSMSTPWGVALIKQQLDDGVFFVQTVEHGGLLIDARRASELLSARARTIGKHWNEFLVFEQDVDIMVVFYEHPELYPWVEDDLLEKVAEDNLRKGHPDYFQLQAS